MGSKIQGFGFWVQGSEVQGSIRQGTDGLQERFK